MLTHIPTDMFFNKYKYLLKNKLLMTICKSGGSDDGDKYELLSLFQVL
jgi:hypothetical protein